MHFYPRQQCDSSKGNVGWSVHHFCIQGNVLVAIGWIAMRCATDVHCSKRINPHDF